MRSQLLLAALLALTHAAGNKNAMLNSRTEKERISNPLVLTQRGCLTSSTSALDTISNPEVMVGTKATLECTFKDLTATLLNVMWVEGSTEYSVSSATSGYMVTNGNLVSGKQTMSLVIDAAQVTGDKSFTCKGTVQNAAKDLLSSAVPLKTFDIVASTSQEVKVGETVSLTCVISDVLAATSTEVTWSDESVVYSIAKKDQADNAGFTVSSPTGTTERMITLSIAAEKVTGDREYTCNIQVDGTWFEKTVTSKTYLVQISSGQETRTGENAEITCMVSMAIGTPSYSWVKGPITVDKTSSEALYSVQEKSTSRSVLTITGSAVTEDATWTCKVTVSGVESSTDVPLLTYGLATSSADVLNGEDAVLTCTASDLSVAPTTAEWTDGTTKWKPSSSTASGYTVTEFSALTNGVSFSTLTIAGALTGGDRMFTCTVYGGNTAYSTEPVQMKIFDIEMSPAETRNSSSCTLTCKIRWASEAPSAVTWTVEGDSTEYKVDSTSSQFKVAYNAASFDSATGTVSSTLVNNNPQADKHYTCNVNYAARTFHGVTTLSVFAIHTQDEAVLAGQSAILTCQIQGYTTVINDDQVKWSSINDGQTADIITTGQVYDKNTGKLTLALTNIQFDKEYTCSIWADGKWHTRTQKVDVFSIDAVDDLNLEGETTSPMCKINSLDQLANDVVTVSWYNGVDITTDLQKSTGGFAGDTLNMLVGATDVTLTCTVNVALYFGVKKFTKTVFVDLVRISHPNVIQTVGLATTLQCTITDVKREAEKTTSWTTVPNSITAGNDYKAVLTQHTNNSHIFVAEISDVQIAKQEGKWACNFVYPRYSSPALTRTINKVLYLDATEWVTVPVVQYKAKDETATYTCQGRSTEGIKINPTYIWTVNGQDRTDESKLNPSDLISTLSIPADYALDSKTVTCASTWTSTPSTILHAMSTSTLLYSKYIATYPNSEVCAEVGGELKITCVVNTIYNSVTSGTTMKWYKDTSATAIAAGSNIDITNQTLSSDSDTETSVLTIKVVSDSDVGKYKCVWDYDTSTAVNREATINFKNALDIESPPAVNSPNILSGHGTSYSVTAEKDSAFPQMTYEWYKDQDKVKTETQASSIATSTFDTGNVMYRSDKDNKYSVKVTWTGTYQTRSKLSILAPIAITDTCRVEYGNLNSQFTVNNAAPYVVTGTHIVTNCSRGYILPKASSGDSMSYTQTCTTNDTIAVNLTDVNFVPCVGGNLMNYEESSHSTMTNDDKASLTLSGGYWTLHKGTTATITCGTGYTLRKQWSSTTTCNATNAGQCTFDGLCVKGCDYSKNANTKTAYVTAHNTSLLANLDQYRYFCEAHTFTPTGANYDVATCNATVGTMRLNSCLGVTFAIPSAKIAVTTMLLSWLKPSYPTQSPYMYTVTLSSASGYSKTKQTVGLNIAFAKLSAATEYTLTFVMSYTGGMSDLKTFTYTTASQTTAADPESKAVSMEAPYVSYNPTVYETLVIYIGSDYVGKKTNFIYKYTNWVQNQHEWSRGKRSIGRLVRRAAVDNLQTVVWIYPSSEDLFESEENMGAWIANSTDATLVSGTSPSLTFDARALYLKDDAQYYVMARVCNPADPLDCVYGNRAIIDVPKDWRITIILCILIPILVIIIIALIIVMAKNNNSKTKKRSMEQGSSYQNKAYKKDGQ